MTASSAVSAISKASKALHPADSQQVFRAVLAALTRPGRLAWLPREPLNTLAPAVLPVFALADLGTGVCMLEPPDAPVQWMPAITTATSAPAWPAELARLVAAVRPVTIEEFESFCRGSAAAPEDGALVTLSVSHLYDGPRRWRLSGPGIANSEELAPRGLPDGFVAARAAAVSGYPAGIDILLVTGDGQTVGLPRTTTIFEEN